MDDTHVFFVPHWHFDHAWIKTHEQYMREMVVPNFRRLVHILEKNPQYNCVIEQATQLESLQKSNPETFNALKPYVLNGRLALVGGQITSPDIIIPSGESLLRNYFYGKRYLQENFGRDTDVAWNVDIFGQSAQYPLILAHMGMKYYVWHRGVNDKQFRKNLSKGKATRPPHPLFRWVCLNGKDSVLSFYQTNTYTTLLLYPMALIHLLYFVDVMFHSKILMNVFTSIARFLSHLWMIGSRGVEHKIAAKFLLNQALGPFHNCPPPRDFLVLIGSDFSAPNSYILQLLSYLQNKKGRGIRGSPKNQWRLSTPQEFFASIASESLKSTDGDFLERERIFSGVWSSRIKEKQACRRSERNLFDLEAFATICYVLTWANQISPEVYPRDLIDNCWHDLLVNQFHDMICGCSIDEVYVDAMDRYDHLQMTLNREIENRLMKLAQFIDTTSDDLNRRDTAYIIFNPLPWTRKIKFGNVVLEDIPPLGYQIASLPSAEENNEAKNDPIVLKSTCEQIFGNFLFQFERNCLVGIKDLASGQYLLQKNGIYWVGAVRILNEKGDTYNSVSSRVIEILKSDKVILMKNSDLETVLTFEENSQSGNLKIQEKIVINHPLREIHFLLQVTNSLRKVKIELCFPHAQDLSHSLASIPFGSKAEPRGIIAVQNWIFFHNDNNGLLLVNTGTPEHIYHPPYCFITLLRSVPDAWHIKRKIPLPTPLALEQGSYEYEFCFCSIEKFNNEWPNVENKATEILHPCRIIEQSRHQGPLPSSAEFLQISDNFAISAIKLAHSTNFESNLPDPKVILRLFNPYEGNVLEEQEILHFLPKISFTPEYTNGMEIPSSGIFLTRTGKSIRLKIDPFDLATIKLNFQQED